MSNHEPDSPQGDGKGWLWSAVALFVALVLIIGYFKYSKVDKKSRSTTPPAASQSPATTPALVLMVHGMTPLSDSINYAFQLGTQSDSIALQVPTIRGDTLVKYSGKGELPFPHETRVRGLVKVTSLNPHKEAEVWIWKIVNIQQ